MKKLYAGVTLNKEELKESNSNRIELEYYKTRKKSKINTYQKTNVYGIEVVKKEYIGRRKIKEKNNMENITNDEKVINTLLSVLKNNKVTPITLTEIIEEVL